MTIKEIIEKLNQEKTFGSRFPVRIIFTESIEGYKNLVRELEQHCDHVLNAWDFCRGTDTAPQLDKISHEASRHEGRHVLILSIGEYLRICLKRELDSQRFQFRKFFEQMQNENSRTRYILPLFACKSIFDRTAGPAEERQKYFLWDLEEEAGKNQKYDISVYAPKFKGAINADAENFTDYLKNWDKILSEKNSCSIVTNLYRNTENNIGDFSIRTIDSPFRYAKDIISDGEKLEEGWLSENLWADFVKRIAGLEGNNPDVGTAIKSILNIFNFDFPALSARWDTLEVIEKAAIWMWYRIFPDSSYYSYVCRQTEEYGEIPKSILSSIIGYNDIPEEWFEQRIKAIKGFNFKSFSDEYFKALDSITSDQLKLKLLACSTHDEKAYAIRLASSMLRKGATAEGTAELFKNIYPALSSYLSDRSGIDEEADDYMAWYRAGKIINRPVFDIPENRINLERFDSRFSVLNSLRNSDSFTLWIDGFGIEWLPVFIREAENLKLEVLSSSIASSILPTETEYNDQWKNDPNSEKWDRLDKVSHNGITDDKGYFTCIARQLEIISEAVKKVSEMLTDHEYVAVTGDHGSSRLAALAFHDKQILPSLTPEDAKSRSFGRFIEFQNEDAFNNFEALPNMNKTKNDGKYFAVMNDYNHFASRGNAAGGNTDDNDASGEIHGGNTPEERLVPVIIFRNPNYNQKGPSSCHLQKASVMKKLNRAEAILEFDADVSEVHVWSQNYKVSCEKISGRLWKITVLQAKSGNIELTIKADGKIMTDMPVLTVKSGISENTSLGI